jgi:hypothetical protein
VETVIINRKEVSRKKENVIVLFQKIEKQMSTQTELRVYKIFHLIRFILNVFIFISALLFLLGGCFHRQLRSSKRQWLMFNLCISMIVFAIINSVFAMIPLAPTYLTGLAAHICTLQNFLEDVAQGQVAYSLLAFAIHQIGPNEWKNRSFLWFGYVSFKISREFV